MIPGVNHFESQKLIFGRQMAKIEKQIFTEIPFLSGVPDQVTNCTIKTLSDMNIRIECIPGTSGGLEQQFLLRVKYIITDPLKKLSSTVRFTSRNPKYFIRLK